MSRLARPKTRKSVKPRLTADPTDWHVKPYGSSRQRCPICNLSIMRRGRHRATTPEERLNTGALWFIWQEDGEPIRIMPHGKNRESQRGRSKPRAEIGATDKIRRRVKAAAAGLAKGQTFAEVGNSIGVRDTNIWSIQQRHPELWRDETDRQMLLACEKVRAELGGPAVLADPDGFVNQARLCEKFCRARGVELFPPSGEMTLTRIFEEHYLPNCLADGAKTTINTDRLVLRIWRIITGDPAIEAITQATLVRFRDVRLAMKTRLHGKPISPVTVRQNLRVIQTLLDHCLPPAPRRRSSLGLLQRVPYLKPPREYLREPRIVSDEVFDLLYQTADQMDWPRIGKLKPCKWWRALLCVALNTALRRGSLFTLKWADVNLEAAELRTRPEDMKTRREIMLPLNETTIDHLRQIQFPTRDLVFRTKHNVTCFHDQFRKLQTLAGIAPEDRVTLHQIRKTACTRLWEHSPQAAQLLLGHSPGSAVTQKHYVAKSGILANAVQGLAQPASFGTKISAVGERPGLTPGDGAQLAPFGLSQILKTIAPQVTAQGLEEIRTILKRYAAVSGAAEANDVTPVPSRITFHRISESKATLRARMRKGAT